MHASMKRLLDYAREAASSDGRPVTGFADIGDRLGVSSATLTNWKARGVSKEGAIQAESHFGCAASWILRGDGPRDAAAKAVVAADQHEQDLLLAFRRLPEDARREVVVDLMRRAIRQNGG